jgi:hypothetical protein
LPDSVLDECTQPDNQGGGSREIGPEHSGRNGENKKCRRGLTEVVRNLKDGSLSAKPQRKKAAPFDARFAKNAATFDN